MSIDAMVESVARHKDGSGCLNLIDRPAKPGGVPGTAGQNYLWFKSSPEDIGQLVGHCVWGESDLLVLGDVTIGYRLGYDLVKFADQEVIREALRHELECRPKFVDRPPSWRLAAAQVLAIIVAAAAAVMFLRSCSPIISGPSTGG